MINFNNIRSGKNCIIWTRVSTKHQEDNGGSLATQKETCEKYANEHGYNVVGYCGGTHESAKTPGNLIKEMTKKVMKDKTISTIIVSEFDRFSRSSWQAIKMLEDLRELGIIVVAAKYGLNTQTKEGLLMAQNTLSMAQWDNQNRSDKFVAGRQACMMSGAYCTKPPIGYRKEGKSRNAWCYPNEKGILLKQAFKWKLQGITSIEIVHRLEALGLKITAKTMHRIFTNPFYAGKIQCKLTNYQMVDGQIEPIISYQNYLKVQDILSGRTGKYKHRKNNEDCPLVKHVICYHDNTPFTAYTKRKNNKAFHYYKCNKQGCGTNVSAKEMHQKYEALLTKVSFSEDMLANFTDLIRSIFKQMNEGQQEEKTALQKSRTLIENKIKAAKNRHVCGEVDDEDYAEVMRDLNEQKDVLMLQLDKLNYNLSNLEKAIPEIVATASNLSTLWHNSDYETKRRIEKLVFPQGIFWDKEIRNYRTENRNKVFDLIDNFSMSYGNKKATSLYREVALCAG